MRVAAARSGAVGTVATRRDSGKNGDGERSNNARDNNSYEEIKLKGGIKNDGKELRHEVKHGSGGRLDGERK
ncbi:hypothetical protein YC2023_033346 [Brassica napus]